MTTSASRQTDSRSRIWGSLGLSLLMIAGDRWWPDSVATTLVRIAFFTYISIWFGLKIRAGYRRRQPHWTRESWQRYLRLAAMPVVSVLVVLLLSTEAGMELMRGVRSISRIVVAVVMVTLLLFGAVGLGIAVDWMERGEPSEQFTRTRWFRWPKRTPISD